MSEGKGVRIQCPTCRHAHTFLCPHCGEPLTKETTSSRGRILVCNSPLARIVFTHTHDWKTESSPCTGCETARLRKQDRQADRALTTEDKANLCSILSPTDRAHYAALDGMGNRGPVSSTLIEPERRRKA